ncbi:MAG: cysteine--tRNA ligase [Thermoplasmatota archaeon]|nr:cysteine--tRNA ligase [Candidatus Thermoplasmatota archaeon]MBU1915476.1 cysteine--tRNA ligase [Candidatus Thermoplasmatota archaeon]
MALVLFNTLSRTKEPFESLHKGKVGMYVCGVTVYDQSHLGHAKSAINFDVIVRYLRHKGYDVNHVTNFTDVDDKIINRAAELSIEPLKLSQNMIDEYFHDMDALEIRRASVYPKASETMPEIIDMVKGLVDKGYAYESNGSVYFSVKKAKIYGKLSGQSLEQMQAGARVEPAEDKHDPMDFALWKAAKPGEISWDSPWGKGRPGWHIECSAMCLKHIGKTVDIHGGGTELVFPHHENEILQSEAFNDAQFVRFWMHNGLLTIDEEKMSKSLKNFFSIKDILTRFSPEVVRFFILNASYRQPLDYTEKSLEETDKALERLQKTYDSMESALKTAAGNDDAKAICEKAWKQFEERMDDDFSTREAAAVMYELAREANRLQSESRLSKKGAENILKVFDDFNDIFGVLRKTEPATTEGDSKIDLLVKARNDARKRKDFSEADRIRKELAGLGVDTQDTKDGTVWKRK